MLHILALRNGFKSHMVVPSELYAVHVGGIIMHITWEKIFGKLRFPLIFGEAKLPLESGAFLWRKFSGSSASLEENFRIRPILGLIEA
jgi:hypothetical protein